MGRGIIQGGLLMGVGAIATLSSALADMETYTLSLSPASEVEITMNLPSGWWGEPEVLGAPLAIFGPRERAGIRPVLLLFPVEGGWSAEGLSAFEGGEEEYRSGREEWLDEVEGTALEFLKPARVSFSNEVSAHVRGYRYLLREKEYLEKVYLVSCNKKLLSLTLLLQGEQAGRRAQFVDKILGSLKCR